MNMVDMKQAPREEQDSPQEVARDEPIYPWGLRLSLNNEALEKLGIRDLPGVGETLDLAAVARVVSVAGYDSENGTERTVELQITRLGLGGSGRKSASASDLYSEE